MVEEGDTLGDGHAGLRPMETTEASMVLRVVLIEERGPGLWISKLAGS